MEQWSKWIRNASAHSMRLLCCSAGRPRSGFKFRSIDRELWKDIRQSLNHEVEETRPFPHLLSYSSRLTQMQVCDTHVAASYLSCSSSMVSCNCNLNIIVGILIDSIRGYWQQLLQRLVFLSRNARSIALAHQGNPILWNLSNPNWVVLCPLIYSCQFNPFIEQQR